MGISRRNQRVLLDMIRRETGSSRADFGRLVNSLNTGNYGMATLATGLQEQKRTSPHCYLAEPVEDIPAYDGTTVSHGECYLMEIQDDGTIVYHVDDYEVRRKIVVRNLHRWDLLASTTAADAYKPDDLSRAFIVVQDAIGRTPKEEAEILYFGSMLAIPIHERAFPAWIGGTAITARTGSPPSTVTPGSGSVDLYHKEGSSLVLLESGVTVYNWAAAASGTSRFCWVQPDGDGVLWLTNEECP